MKRFSVFFAMPALALVSALAVGFTFMGCDNGSTSGEEREPVTYSGTVGSAMYTLKILPPGSLAVLEGDDYELTVTQSGGTKKSSGTVKTVSQNTFTLQPGVDGSPSFTVTTSDADITSITGNITFETGTPEKAPGAVSISGTYVNASGSDVKTLTFTGDRFAYIVTGTQQGNFSGTFTVDGDSITCTVTSTGSPEWTMVFTIINSNTLYMNGMTFTK
jgi:hypothetical protein